jgi:hypothetical protein
MPGDFVSEPSSAAPGWDLLDQLQHFADQALASPSTTPETVTSASDGIEYESDRTDFLETTQTPCPRRKSSKPARIASHYFRDDTHLRQRAPVVRRLWGKGPAKKRVKRTRAKDKTANEKLRDIERTPPRKWRVLYCKYGTRAVFTNTNIGLPRSVSFFVFSIDGSSPTMRS